VYVSRYLTLKEEFMLRLSENEVLIGIFGPMVEEVKSLEEAA